MAEPNHKPGQLLPITADSIPDASGKVFIITGGCSGIGLATVRLLEQKNARGIVMADIAKPSDDLLKSLSDRTLFVQTQVTWWESLVAAFNKTIDRFGSLDGVFANAGVGEMDHLFLNYIDDLTGELKRPHFMTVDINLKGVLGTVKLAAYWFRKLNVPGSIVMTSSISGYETPGFPIYAASKHGIVGILRSSHLDLYEEFKIKLNVVTPGPVLTNLNKSFAERTATKYDDLSKGYEWETQGPEQPALAACHLLLSDEHGRSIAVHGGRFRDVEEVYNAFRDQLFGSELAVPDVSEIGWRNLFRLATD